MIPRLLHQTAKSSTISPRWAPLQKQLLDRHPGWEYKLWSDEDNLQLIRDRRPDLEPAYQALPRPIMRADLIRYVFMEQFGGVYLDTDYQMLKSFDLEDRTVVLPRESDDDMPVYLGNSFLASEPGHPFWTALIQEVVRANSRSVETEHDVIATTGPGAVTKVWERSFQNDGTLFLLPRRWFNPPVPVGDQQLADTLADSEVYGIHWCFGSWRALSLGARIRNKILGWFR